MPLTPRRVLLLAALSGLSALAQPQAAPDTRRSGFEFMGSSTQAMQRDDSLNPAMLWVKQGEAIWNRSELAPTPPTAPLSATNPAATPRAATPCASCHAISRMAGVAARYPAFDAKRQRPINLGQRINLCRQEQQNLPPWAAEHADLLSVESFVAFQSRGMPVESNPDERLKPFLANGRQRYQQRMGQLDLSCAQCHDQRWGQRLGGSVIPQSHPTAYPVYRLEWQSMGSLQRRLRNCMNGVRAELYPYGSLELVELELFLAQQAAGMPLESPGVRP
jgi:sulfur-oxidizing protein SoxA